MKFQRHYLKKATITIPVMFMFTEKYRTEDVSNDQFPLTSF